MATITTTTSMPSLQKEPPLVNYNNSRVPSSRKRVMSRKRAERGIERERESISSDKEGDKGKTKGERRRRGIKPAA